MSARWRKPLSRDPRRFDVRPAGVRQHQHPHHQPDDGGAGSAHLGRERTVHEERQDGGFAPIAAGPTLCCNSKERTAPPRRLLKVGALRGYALMSVERDSESCSRISLSRASTAGTTIARPSPPPTNTCGGFAMRVSSTRTSPSLSGLPVCLPSYGDQPSPAFALLVEALRRPPPISQKSSSSRRKALHQNS